MLLVKAKRLRYQEMDIIDDEDDVRPVQEANAGSPPPPLEEARALNLLQQIVITKIISRVQN